MKTIKIALLLIMILRISASAQNDVSKAEWQAKKIIVDGQNNEWKKPFNFYGSGIGQMYSIANDSSHLFLCFVSEDPLKIRKLIMAGWQINLSSKVKNIKFSSSIIFPPLEFRNDENKENKENVKNNDIADQRRNMYSQSTLINDYKSQLTTVTAKGFKTENGNLPLINEDGINISIGTDSIQQLCYEISIPLNELIAKNLLHLNELLILNVKVNALNSSTSGGGKHDGRYMGRYGGGGYYGGGRGGMGEDMGGGRYGGDFRQGGPNRAYGSGENSDLFVKSSLKQKFELNNK